MEDQSNTSAANHLREEREFFRSELLKQAGSRKRDVVLEVHLTNWSKDGFPLDEQG